MSHRHTHESTTERRGRLTPGQRSFAKFALAAAITSPFLAEQAGKSLDNHMQGPTSVEYQGHLPEVELHNVGTEPTQPAEAAAHYIAGQGDGAIHVIRGLGLEPTDERIAQVGQADHLAGDGIQLGEGFRADADGNIIVPTTTTPNQ